MKSYLSNITGTMTISPSSWWDTTTDYNQKACYPLTTPNQNFYNKSFYVPSGAHKILNTQFIYGQIADQTLSGKFSGQLQCSASNINAALSLACVINVIDDAGNDKRTLYSGRMGAFYYTTLQNVGFSGQLATYHASDNDFIVIEIGSSGMSAGNYSGIQRFAGKPTYLPVNNIESGTGFAAWIDFSPAIIGV